MEINWCFYKAETHQKKHWIHSKFCLIEILGKSGGTKSGCKFKSTNYHKNQKCFPDQEWHQNHFHKVCYYTSLYIQLSAIWISSCGISWFLSARINVTSWHSQWIINSESLFSSYKRIASSSSSWLEIVHGSPV